ncbi:MAG: GGDEF domain-containing protein [Oscillatoriales cyanobacterium]|nr:MAG: GGDEF domain-containing protein [Oscillatoriales cyanobacterium]
MISMDENEKNIINENPLQLPAITPVSEAILAMHELHASCVLVIEKNQLVGIFTERDVVRVASYQMPIDKITLSDLMIQDVFTLRKSEIDNIFDIAGLLIKHHIRHIPVVDDYNYPIGVITPHTLRREMKPEYLLRYIRVGEVMTNRVIQGLTSDSLLEITQKMALHRVSCIVISEPGSKVAAGIITERDIVQFHLLELPLDRVSAKTVMSHPLISTSPQDSLWSTHQNMTKALVRRLVVTNEQGELVGLITQTQMLRLLNPAEVHHVVQLLQGVIDRQTSDLQQLNQQLQVANVELSKLAIIDELTQVFNRRHLNQYLSQEWTRLKRYRRPLAVILCDVDHFKLYNDQYGHLAGDRCLFKVAQTLWKVANRAPDLVARYGGEEFAIVLPETTAEGAEHLVREILHSVHQLQIPHMASPTCDYITISLGAIVAFPAPNMTVNDILESVDRLLYRAKEKGRNTYVIEVIGQDILTESPSTIAGHFAS